MPTEDANVLYPELLAISCPFIANGINTPKTKSMFIIVLILFWLNFQLKDKKINPDSIQIRGGY